MRAVWLLLSVGTDMKRHSHDGYTDHLGYRYSWDSSVPNHRRVLPGDVAIFWDKKTWLGLAVIQSVHFEPGAKVVYKCPSCNSSNFQSRMSVAPKFRCNACAAQFETPVESTKAVSQFWAEFPATWHTLKGSPQSAEIRALSNLTGSQLSMRDCSWEKVQALLETTGNQAVIQFVESAAY